MKGVMKKESLSSELVEGSMELKKINNMKGVMNEG